ncbi:hypothetical protein NDU88_000971 [Pleurodeles waltl]|uniref:Uncharacterized protein n=1 Tax=Pleurodeles waltl TaxID=8319 RepID=A0AAV7VYR9_PLEWA|nr:hypothetical protein NDU88_000971 [Pleurodeles waltl]
MLCSSEHTVILGSELASVVMSQLRFLARSNKDQNITFSEQTGHVEGQQGRWRSPKASRVGRTGDPS